MTYIDDELENEAVAILKEVEQMLTETILLAQQKGAIKNQTNPAVLGKYLVTFWCGLNTLRRMYSNKKTLAEQIEIHLEVIS